jgi:glucose/arabinose dehydrogenase
MPVASTSDWVSLFPSGYRWIMAAWGLLVWAGEASALEAQAQTEAQSKAQTPSSSTPPASLVSQSYFTRVEKAEAPIQCQPLAESLSWDRPVWMTPIPGQDRQWVVLEHRSGKAWRLDLTDETKPQKSLFGDFSAEVSDGPWEGLMCLAFHPGFTLNQRYFIKHETMRAGQRWTVIREHRSSKDGLADSGQAPRELCAIQQPADNHNGGTLAFGPDGMLYFAMGDGGPQEDPQGHAQNLGSWLGKMHRIDVDRAEAGMAYGIPSDNPHASSQESGIRREIYALGLREPWRFSFDRVTGDCWVGDVGQGKYEEVTLVGRGENHGWNVYEGFEAFSEQYKKVGEAYTWPIFVYGRSLGNSITGGYVYRGRANSQYYGAYVCGDYTTRRLWALWSEAGRLKQILQIGVAPSPVASFAEGHDGTLHLVGYDGKLYRLVLP